MELLKSKNNLLKIGNLTTFLVCMVLSGLSSSGMLAGISIAEVSDQYPIRITPADYAFSIWTLIYGLLGLFSGSQFYDYSSKSNDLIYNKIGVWFIINLTFHTLWLVFFVLNTTSTIILSAISIYIMWITSLKMYKDIIEASKQSELPIVEQLGLRLGMGLYSAWLTAASILNLAIMVYKCGVRFDSASWNESDWGTLLIYFASLIYLAWSFKYQDLIFCAVSIWVLAAIIVKQKQYQSIVNTSIIFLVLGSLMFSGLVYINIKNYLSRKNKDNLLEDKRE